MTNTITNVLTVIAWLGIAWGVLQVIVGLRRRYTPTERRRRAYRKQRNARPPLVEWASENARAGSGVWMISPSCGYDNWTLYAPGAEVDANGFIVADPTSQYPANDGPGHDPLNDGPGREPLTLDEVRAWAQPWIEKVSGGTVVQMVDGWGAPYGPNRDMHEYAAFALVKDGTP